MSRTGTCEFKLSNLLLRVFEKEASHAIGNQFLLRSHTHNTILHHSGVEFRTFQTSTPIIFIGEYPLQGHTDR